MSVDAAERRGAAWGPAGVEWLDGKVGARFWKLADWLLGAPGVAGDLATRRQLQATVLVVATAVVSAVPLLAFAFHEGAFVRCGVLGLTLLLFLGTLVDLRVRGRARQGGLQLVLALLYFGTVDSWLGAGLQGAAFPLLLLLPVLGAVLVHHLFGQLIAVVCGVFALMLWAIAPSGLQVPGSAVAEGFVLADRLAFAVGAGATMLVAGVRQSLLARLLGDSRRELEVDLRRLDVVERGQDPARQRVELGASLAEMVHELSNPLTVALASVEVAAAARDADRRGQRLDAASEAIQRMADILDALESRTGDREFVPLSNLLERAVDATRPAVESRARFVVDVAGVTGFVHADATRMVQVFVNLLENAAHAIPQRGGVHTVSIRASEDDGQFSIVIADTGVGLPALDTEQLFEPFWTSRADAGGTGLGLAICRRTVCEHGGTITLAPGEDAGAVACVTLPRLRPSREVVERSLRNRGAGARVANPLTEQMRVLVVDDEPLLVRAMEASLEPAQVTGFTSAREALSLAIELPWDAVVCDVMMPEMTGIDFYEAVIARAPERAPRFLFVTGGVFTDEARRWLAERSDAVLHKPFDRDEIRARVASIAERGDD